jgi:hypothetical protein
MDHSAAAEPRTWVNVCTPIEGFEELAEGLKIAEDI